jgi:hypothetical protein
MQPLPDWVPSVAVLYDYFDMHITSAKQVYDPLRGICINGAHRVTQMSNEELREARNENKLAGCFFPIGGVDTVLEKWSRTQKDDLAGGAGKLLCPSSYNALFSLTCIDLCSDL